MSYAEVFAAASELSHREAVAFVRDACSGEAWPRRKRVGQTTARPRASAARFRRSPARRLHVEAAC